MEVAKHKIISSEVIYVWEQLQIIRINLRVAHQRHGLLMFYSPY